MVAHDGRTTVVVLLLLLILCGCIIRDAKGKVEEADTTEEGEQDHPDRFMVVDRAMVETVLAERRAIIKDNGIMVALGFGCCYKSDELLIARYSIIRRPDQISCCTGGFLCLYYK